MHNKTKIQRFKTRVDRACIEASTYVSAFDLANRQALKNIFIPSALKNKIKIVLHEDGNIYVEFTKRKLDHGRKNIDRAS